MKFEANYLNMINFHYAYDWRDSLDLYDLLLDPHNRFSNTIDDRNIQNWDYYIFDKYIENIK